MSEPSDTGFWFNEGREWIVVQREDGSVVCHSDGWMTAANKSTWDKWKKSGYWVRK
jgi:hypothetical protein